MYQIIVQRKSELISKVNSDNSIVQTFHYSKILIKLIAFVLIKFYDLGSKKKTSTKTNKRQIN